MAEFSSSTRSTGWLFVGAQFVLLVALLALPRADHWPSGSLGQGIGLVLIVGGLAIVGAASLGLGRGLTPTPVPNGRAELCTTGLYGVVRHPIYTGVLIIVLGIVVRSGNLVTLAVGVVTAIFFDRKAAWEEARLTEQFPDYPAYCRTTPRLIPGFRR